MAKSPLMDSSFVVHVFSPGDDPIACVNKAMAFLSAVASSRGDKGKVILVLGLRVMLLLLGETMQADKQGLLNATIVKVKDIWLGNALSLSEQGMQHGIRKKAMLAEAWEARQILNEEQLAFLADLGVPDGQAVQTIIPNTDAFQTEDLNIYDSDCDDTSNAKSVLIANISNYGSDVISECTLSKPQGFYDNMPKQALGYQNLFYHKKAQRIKPTLYDGIVISAKHVAMPMIDDEETLILEEESQSKMAEKIRSRGC
nr:hypothetical protein [Tanacetum cinerariifolium]